MASAEASLPVNGNYGAHAYDSYGAAGASNGTNYEAQPATGSQPSPSPSSSEIPKDEVGWYFVEQYYTTLSKSPDRLYVRLC
jgi:hypothetical protein